ncbi:MAG: hypothetical protein KF868_18680 [Acidobacteria bacterium]|nr:hypothetical protein [Acidobacteriota bacterium]MCW5967564.1 hypothetical protein [Blastocatellales bacterium]
MIRLRRIILAVGVLLGSAGAWLYWQRVTPVDMAVCVPESAIGYFEIGNLPDFADRIASTDAWSRLAPEYGVDANVGYYTKLARVIRATGIGRAEWAAAARAQYAAVVTSLEVRGENVRPRAALIAETHISEDRLRVLVAKRLPELAEYLFGPTEPENSEYAGVAVRLYRAAEGERRLYSAQVGSLWILANHAEAMEACLDARLGRAPNMSGNFYLRQARPVVEGDSFGFVSGAGATRLARFGVHVIGARMFGASPLVDALESVAGNLSAQTSQGFAFGQSIDGSGVTERSLWLLQPQMVEQLRAGVKVESAESRLLAETPAGTMSVTIIRADDPSQSFDAIEAVISSRLGVAESFLFQKFLFGVREALLGLRAGESAGGAFGGEIANLSIGDGEGERLWLIEAGDRAKLEALVVRFLTERGGAIRRSPHEGIEILESSDARRGAAAFVGSAVALGARNAIIGFIDGRIKRGSIIDSPQFDRSRVGGEPAPIMSYSSVVDETGRMMDVLARGLGRNGAGRAIRREIGTQLEGLPLEVGEWRLGERGVQGKTHSPFGSLPWVIGLFAGPGQEEAR